MSYVQLTSPLILFADPVLPTHAVTKRYVDNKQSAVDASWFTSGVVPVSMMPALTGDVVSAAGSGVTTLSATGVANGSYSKVTVSSSGRVVSGGSLVAGDIPSVSWSKITGGKPTTAGGYGITNLIALSGGSSSGAILSSATPSSALHAVTKGYVDNAVVGVVSGVLNVGDVVRKTTAVTPTGFLRCNGGLADKTTYSNLFSVIGYSLYLTVTLDYVSSGAMGAGQPWRQQYDINTTQSGDITSWVAGTTLPGTNYSAQAIVTKNRVYLLGGRELGGAVLSTIYTAYVNSDGALSSWTTSPVGLPFGLFNSCAVVTKNRVYLLGGYQGGNGYTNIIITSTINTDGTLGVWSTASTTLPQVRFGFHPVVTKSKVYLIGSGVVILSAPVNTDGTLGTWDSTITFPVDLTYTTGITTKNRVYILGGNVNAFASSGIYTAAINSSGYLGNWTQVGNLPTNVYNAQSVVTKSYAYIIGGTVSTGAGNQTMQTVLRAPVGSDGALGTWVTDSSLPVAIEQSQIVITRNKIHILGGYGIGGASSTVYSAPISGGLNDYSYLYDGSVNKFDGSDTTGTVIIGEQIDTTTNYVMPGSGQPWRQQYDINTTQSGDIGSWITGGALPTSIGYSQVVVTKNRAYIIGGYIPGGVSNAVYTCPVNSDGSLGGWVGGGPTLPQAIYHTQAIVTKNRVYLLGGKDVNDGSLSTVYTSSIGTDGTLGAWTTSSSLPGAMGNQQAIVTKNRVYLLGGINGSEINKVYTAPINTDGTLGAWATDTTLPANISNSQSIVTKNRVYLLGGYISGLQSSAVYTASINTDGTLGTWVAGTSLPGTFAYGQGVATKNRAYLIGGRFNSANSAVIYSAPINGDGTLGAWATTTSLPGNASECQVAVTGNRIHVIGAYGSSTVYTAPISGGLNDYSPYYDGTIQPVDTQNSINYQMPGSGQPWRQQYDINTTQSADITGWTTGTALLGPKRYHQAVVTKNRVYLIGGLNTTQDTGVVHTSPINSDGTLGVWASADNLPNTVSVSHSIVTKNRVYLLGGGVNGVSSNITHTAVINTDGTLGPWSMSTPLNATVYASQAVVTKNRVYLLGGEINGSNSAVVHTAPINTDGTLGTWATSAALPGTAVTAQAIVTKNRVYLVGGFNGSTASSAVYTAPINTDGTLGTWTTGTSLPVALYDSRSVVTRNRVYLLGGYNNGMTSAVYTAPINTDGTLGTWTTGTSLPVTIGQGEPVVTKNRIYMLGGYTAGSLTVNSIYTATISGGLNDYSPYYDGTIQPATASSFKLPDFTASETNNINYYIKY